MPTARENSGSKLKHSNQNSHTSSCSIRRQAPLLLSDQGNSLFFMVRETLDYGYGFFGRTKQHNTPEYNNQFTLVILDEANSLAGAFLHRCKPEIVNIVSSPIRPETVNKMLNL